MTALLPPPIPRDVDLSGFDFMPLYVPRLRKSRAFARCRAMHELTFPMINLWSDAYLNVPCGSIENDEMIVAGAAQCSLADMRLYKTRGVLDGWIACSDGRLYHPVICEIGWGNWLNRLVLFHDRYGETARQANKRLRDSGQAERSVLKLPDWVRDNFPATAAAVDRRFDLSDPPLRHRLYKVWPYTGALDQAAALSPGHPALPDGVSGVCHADATRDGPRDRPPPEGARTAETGSKEEGKGQTSSPPSPPVPGGLEVGLQGLEVTRRDDFVALFQALGQPDAPLRTAAKAWCEVAAAAPGLGDLLEAAALWREAHAAKEKRYRKAVKPMGPARLIRERFWVAALAERAREAEASVAAREAANLRERERLAAEAGRATAADAADAVKLAAFHDGLAGLPGIADALLAKVGHPIVLTWLCDATFVCEVGAGPSGANRIAIFVRNAGAVKHLKKSYANRFDAALGHWRMEVRV